MTSESHSVLRRIEEEARIEYLPIVGAEKGAFLESLVRDTRPCKVVEIGVMVGYLTIYLARALADGCAVIGVEIAEDLAARARQNVTDAGLADKIDIRRGDASTLLADIPGPIGLVVMDGPRALYKNHLRILEPKLRDGSLIVAHIGGDRKDAFKPYLDMVRNDPRFESEYHQFGEDGWEVSLFKSGS